MPPPPPPPTVCMGPVSPPGAGSMRTVPDPSTPADAETLSASWLTVEPRTPLAKAAAAARAAATMSHAATSPLSFRKKLNRFIARNYVDVFPSIKGEGFPGGRVPSVRNYTSGTAATGAARRVSGTEPCVSSSAMSASWAAAADHKLEDTKLLAAVVNDRRVTGACSGQVRSWQVAMASGSGGVESERVDG